VGGRRADLGLCGGCSGRIICLVAVQPSGTVTLVFTDIEGSTVLLGDLGAEAYREALAEHRRVVREAFAAHSGFEVDDAGDGLFYAFASASAAVAAVAQAMALLAEGPVRIRVGVHTGEPVVDPPKYVGADVHKAARIMSAAHGGQVVVSGATRELVAEELLDLGRHRLKDFDEPVSLFQLGAGRFPPLRTISNTNVPVPLSSFVGRKRELIKVVSVVRDEGARLVTLAGPGGTGKTRLAIEAAGELVRDFQEGVIWVGLAPVRDPALVVDTIAQTLGAKQDLAGHIGEKQILLVLDNLEQVVESSVELAALLRGCPNLRLLVTSRELLRVDGEVVYQVPALADPEAIELFCARARIEPDEPIAELCGRLDNLPLALELAAARVSVLTPAQILERISQRLDLFGAGRDADPRQQTLRATIAWSYDLLAEHEEQLFTRMAVFRGGCTLESAEQVADADVAGLQSLLDKSLLRRSGERFWMLETIREFASEMLEQSGEALEIRDLHARWYLHLADEARSQVPFSLHASVELLKQWRRRLGAEHDNLRTSFRQLVDRGNKEEAIRLANDLSILWTRGGGWDDEGERWLSESLDMSGPATDRTRALGLLALGTFRVLMDQPNAALPLFQEGLQVARTLGEGEMTFQALRGLAQIANLSRDFDRARRLYDEMLALDLPPVWSNQALIELAGVEIHARNVSGARERLQQAEPFTRKHPRTPMWIGARHISAVIDLLEGEIDQAEREFIDVLSAGAEAEWDRFIGPALSGLASACAHRGDLRRAGRLWGAATRLREERGVTLVVPPGVHYDQALSEHDEPEFVDAVEEGRRIELDAAVAYALGESGWPTT
jgi:predicted ATPase/class 3 adenylate cyclase